ncbi:MAG TPA: PQQ-dependent sugar dehydrogenase [Acidimicrobiia bacterium]
MKWGNRRLALVPALAVVVSLIVPALPAGAAPPPGGTYWDDDGNTHEGMIEAITAEEITQGCGEGQYCPGSLVTRGQMASFLARAFDLPPASGDHFSDDGGSPHEDSINAVFEAGIANGYPGGTFDPQGIVTRQHMATFLARALGLTPIPGDQFADVEGIHEPNVNAIADAGITQGCNQAGTLFCPHQSVRRDQMASFLGRALGLTAMTPAPLRLRWSEVATGFGQLTNVAALPDGALLVVEKGGTIWRLQGSNRTVFLNLASLVSAGSEQGLLGIALHPDFGTNRRLYVDYTDTSGDTRVVEYTAAAGLATASPGSARQIIRIDQPFANHNGGMIEFGPDGFLYIGMGDGGGGGDPQDNAQNPSRMLGKILRVDVDDDDFPADPGRNYGIPNSNPFVGGGGALEVWALGLRNPWRFAFDEATNRIYVGDVGQDRREEVDVISLGQVGVDFGWDRLEGNICYEPSSGCPSGGTTRPVLDYTHSVGFTVIGGMVYRGSAIPALRGAYIYSDLARWVRTLRFIDGAAKDRREWPSLERGSAILSFGVDLNSEILAVTSNGVVLRLVPG